ncbi:MAG: hypothetical protein ACRC5C_10475 [Bacilli bacterium]
MQFTSEAKHYLQQLSRNYPMHILKFAITEGCCGMDIRMYYAPISSEDIIAHEDGVDFIMPPNGGQVLKDVTVACEEIEGEITLVLYNFNGKIGCSH